MKIIFPLKSGMKIILPRGEFVVPKGLVINKLSFKKHISKLVHDIILLKYQNSKN